MFYVLIALFLFGLLCLVAESIVPGGVLGFIGWIAIIASVVVCFEEYGAKAGTIYLILSTTISAAIAISLFFVVAKRLAIKPPVPAGEHEGADERIGQSAVTLMDLDPTGFVDLDGKRVQARSESSEKRIGKNEEVLVVAIDSTFLVVRLK